MNGRTVFARAGIGIVAGGLVVAGLTAGVSPAAASTTVTFNYTGSNQSFVVPSGVSTLAVVATGGGGGGGLFASGFGANNGSGGAGAVVTSSLAVAAGQTLTIAVGGGGKAPADTPWRCAGGGGSTIVTQASTDVIVAGGGGGGGGATIGGSAGNPDGSGSKATYQGIPDGGNGGNVGGTGLGGAADGNGSAGGNGTRGAGGPGGTGVAGGGQAGGPGGAAAAGGGGGGGGAGYGGGGGGRSNCWGGGGGGSLGPAGRTFAAASSGPGAPGQPSDGLTAGTNGGDGRVTITYTVSGTPSAKPGTILPANAKINKNGTTQVTSANPKTTTGQTIKTRVTCKQRTRGDIQLCKVIHKKNGATYVKTYGIPLTITITWYAAATSTSKAYKKVRTYKT